MQQRLLDKTVDEHLTIIDDNRGEMYDEQYDPASLTLLAINPNPILLNFHFIQHTSSSDYIGVRYKTTVLDG